ncbi:interleukin-like EMT inducer domain-containing protein [Paenibacillus sp. F6_3S_P_1C]|uniref:Interleukin-like EMT inducer domain-containing protein n=1 Tax=Paenibacillus vandeheii TaxID=3035917 RepID=A0ABT8JHW1_9BACL|nr:interleukin-like EMT inducer domain-containing protein [Paenibacillus vandeheii]MDN4603749.1 interleukin-like EMT inducer domain-containing protein [Paenibacillus vandeheii]
MNSELDLSLLDYGAIYIPLSNYSRSQNDLAYAAYRSMFYRKNDIWIEDISKIDLDLNRKSIYFHTSIYIPQFSQHNYSVELTQGKSLVQYLMETEVGSYVVISIKDDGSQQIKDDVLEEVKALGITLLDSSKLRYSYIWLARKTNEISYEVIYQECSSEELSWEGQLDGNHILIKSSGANGGNYSSVMIDGVEESKNSRGMNIVSWKESHKVVSTNFDTFSTIYMQGSLFKATPSNLKRNDTQFSVVSHAAGMFQGLSCTNCREAVEWNYRVKGHRIFEIDFELTSDGEMVARHNWQTYLYDYLQQKPPEGVKEDEPLTLAQFKELKILNKYTPLTITDIYELMVNYPDLYIVTDTKYLKADIVKTQFKRIISAVEPYGYELLLRIVPQIYWEDMYSIIEEIFPFPSYIYTLYATHSSDEQILQFVEGKPIGAVTTYPDRYTSNFGRELKSLGVEVALHTINDMEQVKKYVGMNVDGFYTDSLSSSDIESEITRFQSEVNASRDMLLLYIEKRFGTVTSSILNRFQQFSKQELEEFAPKLFLINTLEEFYQLCEEVKFQLNA